METLQFAAIDIGSNALRLLFMHVYGREQALFEKASLVRVPVRLGADVFTRGYISPAKQDRLINAVLGFSYLIKAHDVDGYKACATSAMREASNGREVAARIARETGIQVEIISGEKEAQIIYSNQIAQLIDPDHLTMYVDVGGGSAEVTLFRNDQALASESFRVGTVRMLKDRVEESEWQRLKQWVKKHTRDEKPSFLIGSGGNINKLIKLLKGKKSGDKHLTMKELEELHGKLSGLTVEERMVKYALNPDRADVIVPAANIYLNILQWSGCKEVYVPRVGLADGMCHDMYNQYVRSKPVAR